MCRVVGLFVIWLLVDAFFFRDFDGVNRGSTVVQNPVKSNPKNEVEQKERHKRNTLLVVHNESP